MTIQIVFSSYHALVWILVSFFFVVWLDLALVRDCWRSHRSENWKVFWTAFIVSFPIIGGVVYLKSRSLCRDDAQLAVQEAALKRRLNAEAREQK